MVYVRPASVTGRGSCVDKPTSVDLFAGAGGLALGIHSAGFEHRGLVEFNRHACGTLRRNAEHGVIAPPWPVFEHDVRTFDYHRSLGVERVDLLAGGAPCQPFSLGGKHRGNGDGRNMFPEVFRAVRALRPKIVLLENVRGLRRQSFKPYFEYILRQLEMPHIALADGEEWFDHDRRLQGERDAPHDVFTDERYHVQERLLNSADFGAPQKRERVIMVATRRDLSITFAYPSGAYSEDRLLYEQYVTGDYWDRHNLAPRPIPEGLEGRVRRLSLSPPAGSAWRTLRDAIGGMPEPVDDRPADGFDFHIGIPGARLYAGHTGCVLDKPSKTIKAGDHGNPGGEHIVIRDDGTFRYLTVRECARVQAFPDAYRFAGTRTEAMRQIGNAVPVALGEAVAHSARSALDGAMRWNTRWAAMTDAEALAVD